MSLLQEKPLKDKSTGYFQNIYANYFNNFIAVLDSVSFWVLAVLVDWWLENEKSIGKRKKGKDGR